LEVLSRKKKGATYSQGRRKKPRGGKIQGKPRNQKQQQRRRKRERRRGKVKKKNSGAGRKLNYDSTPGEGGGTNARRRKTEQKADHQQFVLNAVTGERAEVNAIPEREREGGERIDSLTGVPPWSTLNTQKKRVSRSPKEAWVKRTTISLGRVIGEGESGERKRHEKKGVDGRSTMV